MLPGPVFEAEMRTLARRWRHYAARVAYAVVLLIILAQNYFVWVAAYPDGLGIQQVAELAQTVFYSVAAFQLLAVMIATPSLVAGSIAEERQRKTLDYLLSSRLTSLEIVVGKLAARLAQMGVSLLVGVPVLALLSLLGGIDPLLNLLLVGAALSTMLVSAAWSVWMSSTSRRPREAMSAAYALAAFWVVFPLVLRFAPLGRLPGWAFAPISWTGQLVQVTSPFSLLLMARQVYTAGADVLVSPTLRMIATHLALSLIFVGMAARQVRPYAQRLDGPPKPIFGRSRVEKVGKKRPSCGERPMRWKELRTERRRGLARFAERAAALGLAALVIYGAARILIDITPLGPTRFRFDPVGTYNSYLSVVSALLSVILVAQVLVTAAGSITGEREGDTWTALTATTLDRREILGAKLLGALWRGRGLFALIGFLWVVGLIVGSLDWRVFIMAGVYLGVFAVFGGCLGLLLSLVLPTTNRAQVLGFGLLFLINILGQASLGLWHSAWRSYAPQLFPGCMPFTLGRTLDFNGPAYWLLQRSGGVLLPWLDPSVSGTHDEPPWLLVVDVGGVTVYAVAAWLLWRLALVRFAVTAGRPRRSSPMPTKPAAAAAIDAIAPSA